MKSLVSLVVTLALSLAGAASAQETASLSDTVVNDCFPSTATISVTSLPSTIGFDFEITYDPNVVIVDEEMDVDVGGLTAGCEIAANPLTPGVVLIAIACGEAVMGSGTVATILFDPVAPGTTSLQWQECRRNEAVCNATDGGSIALSGCPLINLSPPLNPTPTPQVFGAALPGRTVTPTPGGETADGVREGRACVGATLSPNGAPVAATRTEITYDARFQSPVCALSTAAANAGKSVSTQLTPGNPSSVLAVTVSGGANLLPSGALFVCTFRTPLASVLPLGFYDFTNRSSAADPNDVPIGASGLNSRIRITACNGDCDGSNGVGIPEVVRAINEFGGTPLCNFNNPGLSCPAADGDNSGGVIIGEVIQSINRFGGNPPCP